MQAITIPHLPHPLHWLNQPQRWDVSVAGGLTITAPADYPYGERQYTVEDLGGHRWTFSQTIADVDPKTWGGILFED